MDSMPISKFKATCLACLERVRKTGQPLRVTRFGKPVADIVPPAPEPKPGSWLVRLDTHVVLWSVLKPDRLVASVRRALSDNRNELWISPISIWESLLLLKHERVKISNKVDETTWLLQALDGISFRDAPITRQVALATIDIVLEHQDPADRFLAATAAVYDLTLVTADEKLLRGKGFRTLANA